MRKYDIILLDADDTVFDFGAAELAALKRLFQMYGIPYTDENVRDYQTINDEMWRQFETGEITKEYLLDHRFAFYFEAKGIQADGVKANQDYLDGLAEGNVLLPGALTLVQKMKDLGCKAYPATNGVTRVQKQRLAIARAIAKPAAVYIFDDSFSALDFLTESRLRARLSERLKAKTQIVVTQRVSTAMNCDKIFVFDGGRLVASGTHAQLMQTCSVYREIEKSQSGIR